MARNRRCCQMNEGRTAFGAPTTARVGLLVALLWPTAFATEPVFERISVAEGLAQSSIHAMAQCEDGFLWFGTQYGLDRYDGHRFVNFRHDPDDPASLSHSAVNDLLLSQSGRLWVATRDGLNDFDPRTGTSERFFPPELSGPGFRRASPLNLLFEAEDGRVYLQQAEQILVWHPQRRQLERLSYLAPFDGALVSRESAVLDGAGRLWLLNGAGLWAEADDGSGLVLLRPLAAAPRWPFHRALALTAQGRLALALDDALELIDPQTLQVERRIELADIGHGDQWFNAVNVSADGRLWLTLVSRLLRYDPITDEFELLFDAGGPGPAANERQYVQLIEAANGAVWLSSQFALGRYHPDEGRLQVLRHDPRNDQSIPATTRGARYTLFVDREDNVWVGSALGGLGRHSPLSRRFDHLHDASPVDSERFAGHNVIRGIAEQRINDREYLWLALDHGGLRRYRRLADGRYQKLASYHDQAEPPEHRLPGNMAWAVVADPISSRVWALLGQTVVAIDGNSGAVLKQHDLPISTWGRGSNPMILAPDHSALWVGSTTGIHELILGEDRLSLTPNPGNPFLGPGQNFGLLALGPRQVLVGGGRGFGMVDFSAASPSFFVHLPGGADVYGLAPHPQTGWWLGTRDRGLVHVRPGVAGDAGPRFEFQWYGREHGLIDDTLYAILPDAEGWLWLSSNRGLMRWHPERFELRHYTPADGIQSFEFNNTVAHTGPSGRFYFGGINGVNGFLPEALNDLMPAPRVHLAGISVRGRPLDPLWGVMPELRLRHDMNDLELEYVGLMFSAPARVRYAHRLDGLDADWVTAGDRRFVRYTALPPGDYRFYVRAANGDGVWSEERLLLTASIAAPPWQTAWAWILYLLLGLLLLSMLWIGQRRRQWQLAEEVRLRTAELTEQQALVQRQAAELAEALGSRTRLFASVSHEFRTPLTLIEAAFDRLARDGGDPAVVARGRRYLHRLLRLVEQLLDLSRLRVDPDQARGEPWQVSPVVALTVEAFRPLADHRGIELKAEIEPGWSTGCRQEQVEKILLNLLTNAIKFSSAGSEVRVELGGAGTEMVLTVADTGPGIAVRDQQRIFEPFRRGRLSGRHDIPGAGLGLALVREAAEALSGRIELDSRPGQGSRFRVVLPGQCAAESQQAALMVSAGSLALDAQLLAPDQPIRLEPDPAVTRGPGAARILVVEDNADLRTYLGELLAPHGQLLFAADGRHGLALARCESPDLIVSDIMMPEMDGLQLLAALRDDLETSHIPILMLTARQDDATRLDSLRLNADDFLAKPFAAEELQLRIKRMLANRERLRRRLLGAAHQDRGQPEDAAAPDRPELAARDQAFLAELNRLVESRCTDPDFRVEDLASALAVERRTLQRKLKALTGLTPVVYLRHLRLQRALDGLKNSEDSVTAIALSCGFASPQHFSRLFRRTYGRSPDQWRRE